MRRVRALVLVPALLACGCLSGAAAGGALEELERAVPLAAQAARTVCAARADAVIAAAEAGRLDAASAHAQLDRVQALCGELGAAVGLLEETTRALAEVTP